KRGQSTLNIEVALSDRQTYAGQSGTASSGSAAGNSSTIVGDITVGGGGDGDGRTCFVGTTRIDLKEGCKLISDITVGEDNVLAFDGGVRIPKLVIGKQIHLVDKSLLVKFEDGELTQVTPNHRYWNGSIYLPIVDLESVLHWEGRWRPRRILEK